LEIVPLGSFVGVLADIFCFPRKNILRAFSSDLFISPARPRRLEFASVKIFFFEKYFYSITGRAWLDRCAARV